MEVEHRKVDRVDKRGMENNGSYRNRLGNRNEDTYVFGERVMETRGTLRFNCPTNISSNGTSSPPLLSFDIDVNFFDS